MSSEDNIFTGLRLRLPLLTRNTTPHLLRYSSRPVEPVDFGLSHVRTHPGSACIRIQIYSGGIGSGALARATGVRFMVTGSLTGATGLFFGLSEVLLEPIFELIHRSFFSR
jgi:hypothetical protein